MTRLDQYKQLVRYAEQICQGGEYGLPLNCLNTVLDTLEAVNNSDLPLPGDLVVNDGDQDPDWPVGLMLEWSAKRAFVWLLPYTGEKSVEYLVALRRHDTDDKVAIHNALAPALDEVKRMIGGG